MKQILFVISLFFSSTLFSQNIVNVSSDGSVDVIVLNLISSKYNKKKVKEGGFQNYKINWIGKHKKTTRKFNHKTRKFDYENKLSKIEKLDRKLNATQYRNLLKERGYDVKGSTVLDIQMYLIDNFGSVPFVMLKLIDE